MRRTKSWLPITAVSLALVVAGCGGGDGDSEGDPPADQQGGSFSVSSSEPEAFAPTSACYSSDCSQIINQVLTSLLQRRPGDPGAAASTMAESIESEDGQNWTIKLKDGFTFHNGEPVNAAVLHHAWNYTAYAPNATQLGFFFAKVEGYDDLQGEKPKAKEMSGLKMVDDLTFTVTLTEPFSQFPPTLGYSPAFFADGQGVPGRHQGLQRAADRQRPLQDRRAVEAQQSITRREVRRTTRTRRPRQRRQDRVQDLRRPEHGLPGLPGRRARRRDQPDPAQVPQAPGAQYGDQLLQVGQRFVHLRRLPVLRQDDFKDMRIRQALSMAIDRQAIIDAVFNGRFTPAQRRDLAVRPGYRDDACEYCKLRPGAGQGALRRGRWLDGRQDQASGSTTTVATRSGSQAVATSSRPTSASTTSSRSQPFTPYLETARASRDVDRPVPPRLGARTTRSSRPTSSRCTARAARATELRLRQPRSSTTLIKEGDARRRMRRRSRSTSRPRTSCSRTCRSSRCGSARRSVIVPARTCRQRRRYNPISTQLLTDRDHGRQLKARSAPRAGPAVPSGPHAAAARCVVQHPEAVRHASFASKGRRMGRYVIRRLLQFIPSVLGTMLPAALPARRWRSSSAATRSARCSATGNRRRRRSTAITPGASGCDDPCLDADGQPLRRAVLRPAAASVPAVRLRGRLQPAAGHRT